jgi:chaperonin GroEL
VPVKPRKLTSHSEHARASLLRGVDAVADLVGPTLGPCGRHVVINRHDAGPLITNDGVTIVRSVERLADPLANQGAQMLRDVAGSTDEAVGDGTTTATLLARAMLRQALRLSTAGAEPVALRSGLEQATRLASDWIRAHARPVQDGDVERVATLAARDPHIGRLVAQALDGVGPDGLVTVEDDRAYGISLEVRAGMTLDRGLASPAMAFDRERRTTVLEEPYVLVAEERLTEIDQLVGVLSLVADRCAPLVIVADEVSGQALTLLALNIERRRLPVIAIKSPMYGADRSAALRDVAITTGAELLGPGLGRSVARAGLEHLGRADRVVASHDESTIVGGRGDRELVRARAREIHAEIRFLDSEYERDKRRLRLGRLDGAVAVFRIGLDTQAEQEETRHRVWDALHAGRAALKTGIVPGGGTMLVRAADALPPDGTGDLLLGRAMLQRALETPLRQLARNADLDPGVAVRRVRGAPAGHGLDVCADRVVDLSTARIIDPAGVVCAALDIAASIAGIALMTELIVVERPVYRPARRGHPHGHHHHHDPDHHHPRAQRPRPAGAAATES